MTHLKIPKSECAPLPVRYLASAEQRILKSDVEDFYQNLSDGLDFKTHSPIMKSL
jgi:hypothetical protein